MEEHWYEYNGVALDELDDFQLYNESRDRGFEHALLSLIWVGAAASALVWVSSLSLIVLYPALATMIILGAFPSLLHFAHKGRETKRLPNSPFAPRVHDHITGLGATITLALVAFVVGAAVLGDALHPEFTIPEWFGWFTVFAVCGVLSLLILAPRIGVIPSLSSLATSMRHGFSFLNPLGKAIGSIDSWLVLIVAPTMGAACERWSQRYFLLAANLIGAAAFSWFAPAPYGFIGIAWVLLTSASLFRRWNWIEHDREKNTRLTRDQKPLWRTGSTQDLRDESLWALLFLVLVLPFGMRQVHLTFSGLEVFSLTNLEIDDPTAWLGFFGIELLKAIPFIDWSDIYNAQGQTRIEVASPIAMHAVFGARITIDLLFLSAVVQAVTISVSFARQRADFLAGDPKTTKLDERIEKAEISKLANIRDGGWVFEDTKIERFKRYDLTRLHLLRLNAQKGSNLSAAIDEIFRRLKIEFEEPQDLLLELSLVRYPDRDKVAAVLDNIQLQKKINLHLLQKAREGFSRKSGIEAERQRIAKIIVKCIPPSDEKVAALANIVAGDTKDSLAAVRNEVLPSLQQLARRYQGAREALYSVALNDTAPSLQLKARNLLKSIGWWTKLNTHTRNSLAA